MRADTFWKGYFGLLAAVVVANYGIEAARDPGLYLRQWPLTLAGLTVVAVNGIGLWGFIRGRPLLAAWFWRLLVFFDLGVYGWAGGRILTTILRHPAGWDLAAHIPFTLAGALILPLPLFVALYRYSGSREVWTRDG